MCKKSIIGQRDIVSRTGSSHTRHWAAAAANTNRCSQYTSARAAFEQQNNNQRRKAIQSNGLTGKRQKTTENLHKKRGLVLHYFPLN